MGSQHLLCAISSVSDDVRDSLDMLIAVDLLMIRIPRNVTCYQMNEMNHDGGGDSDGAIVRRRLQKQHQLAWPAEAHTTSVPTEVGLVVAVRSAHGTEIQLYLEDLC